MTSRSPETIISELPCWQGKVSLREISGGLSNKNYLVTDQDGLKYVARFGGDVLIHGVLRINDYNCNRAATAVGIAPDIHYYQSDVLVINFIESRTLQPKDLHNYDILEKVMDLVDKTHHQAFLQLRGPIAAFWPFRVCRDYGFYLAEHQSRIKPQLQKLIDINNYLEKSVGSYRPVLGHNDLLSANLLDDGHRLWLIDWEHAGLTSPLFDLANLVTNNDLNSDHEDWVLHRYFSSAMKSDIKGQYKAMKSASLLREALWSLVSEINSVIDFDYKSYSNDYLERFYQSLDRTD